MGSGWLRYTQLASLKDQGSVVLEALLLQSHPPCFRSFGPLSIPGLVRTSVGFLESVWDQELSGPFQGLNREARKSDHLLPNGFAKTRRSELGVNLSSVPTRLALIQRLPAWEMRTAATMRGLLCSTPQALKEVCSCASL